MSTKIYDGHLWLGTADELMPFLDNLREIYVNEATDILSRHSLDDLKKLLKSKECMKVYDVLDLIEKIIAEGACIDINFDASIMVYFHQNKISVIPFGLNTLPKTQSAFNSDSRMKYYGYWNNTDPDEECSEKEWSERKYFYGTMFDDKHSLYSSTGLVYELSSHENLFMIASTYYSKLSY